jgi:RimJ/RimL family protein N-acetyltransferase
VTFARARLEGERVRLRTPRMSELALWLRWLGDPDVRHWLHLSEEAELMGSRAAQRERLEHIRDDPERILWVIERKPAQPIGDLSLIGIHPTARRAELAICIGEKDAWSQGLGSEAIRLALRHAFRELDLRRVTLIADADNARGIRCYEKCGFRPEGVLRAHRLRYGQPLDMLAMGVLREEFERAEAARGGGSGGGS